MTAELLGGIHVGFSSLYGVLLQQDGEVVGKLHRPFSSPEEMVEAYDAVAGQLSGKAGLPALWTLALEKSHRLVLAPRRAELSQLKQPPTVVQPALSAVLLGAIPAGPGILVSLGREIRLAMIDSTLTYREYRVNEGGGAWWQRELVELAKHSPRLERHLADRPLSLKDVPRLLEMGRFPTPDPVLKPRLEKIADRLVGMVLTLATRQPGLGRYTLSGYLARSALGELVSALLKSKAPELRPYRPAFPPEVGAALSGLALQKENWEREHLRKPPFEQDHGVDEWTPPKTLVRRLYRLRKPFERYP